MSNSYRKYIILIAIISATLELQLLLCCFILSSCWKLNLSSYHKNIGDIQKITFPGKQNMIILRLLIFIIQGEELQVNDCIQVRKQDNRTKKEIILGTFEKYKILISYCFNGDSLTLVLKHNFDCTFDCDTYVININE